jgi:hypothetical protein
MSSEEINGDAQADATAEQGAVAVSTASILKIDEDPLGFLHAATKRNFGETEVTSAITLRFLVEKVKEQRNDIERLRDFETKYHQVDKDLQIERSKTKLGKIQEIVSSALLTIGGIGMGMAAKFIETSPGPSIIAFILCAGVTSCGFYLKVGSR